MNKYRKKEAVKKLVSARKAYTYSQLEAAREIGLTLLQYREVERTERPLTQLQATRLAEKFSIDIRFLQPLIEQE